MEPLVTMVKYGRTECLSHALCETLLQRKWNRYGLLMHGLSTIFYLTFLFILTTIIITYPSCVHKDSDNHDYNYNLSSCQVFTKNTYFVNLRYFLTLKIFFSIMNILTSRHHFKIKMYTRF